MYIIVKKQNYCAGHGEYHDHYVLAAPAYRELEPYPIFRTRHGAQAFVNSLSPWAREYYDIIEMSVAD